MKEDISYAKACESRQLRMSGREDDGLRMFRDVFYSGSGELRTRLVLEMPEFFMGGDGSQLPEVSIDALSSVWFDLLCQTSISERVGLFGLAVALMPSRMLEIGRARGGSTVILNAARRLSGCRNFVSLDPNVPGEHYLNDRLAELLSRDGVKLINGCSPAENSRAVREVGGPFDFVFIDGDHSFESCLRDLRGVVDVLSDNGYVLLHDAYYPGVQDAVDEVLKSEEFVDCGLIGRDRNEEDIHHVYLGRPVVWGGLRLLRKADSENKIMSLLSSFRRLLRR